MEMLIHNHIECDGALSDLILQAARQAIPADVNRLITLPDSGRRNNPILPLLVGLLDAAQQVARVFARVPPPGACCGRSASDCLCFARAQL